MSKKITYILITVLLLELLPMPTWSPLATFDAAPPRAFATHRPGHGGGNSSSSLPFPDSGNTEERGFSILGASTDPQCADSTQYIIAAVNDGQEKAGNHDWQENGNQWGAEGGAAYHGAVRFSSAVIPQGEDILSATLSLYSDDATTGPPNSIIYGMDEDDTATYSDSSYPSGRPYTTSTVNISNWSLSVGYNSKDVTDIVQEIVDRSGWQSGNHIGLLLKYTGGTGSNNAAAFRTWESYPTSTARLIIDRDCLQNPIQNISYEYDANGNITKITDTSNTATAKITDYTYDDLNRLIIASTTNATSGVNYSHTYNYNSLGNITSSTPNGTYVYGSSTYANPHAATSINSVTHTYDNNGNLTGDSTWTHTWDYRNRLASSAATTTVSYLYDHTNTRTKLVTSNTSTIIVSPYYSTEDGSAIVHIPGLGQTLATARGTGTSSLYFLHPDHLGSTDKTTNSTGAVRELYDYFPYGNTRQNVQTGGFNDRKGFIGKDFDDDTGLSQLEARYYDGRVGRFISQDPTFLALGDQSKVSKFAGMTQQRLLSDPQALNSYSYARNNPIVLKDPEGNMFVIDDAFGAFFGSAVGAVSYVAVGLATGQDLSFGGLGGSMAAGAIMGVGTVNAPYTGGTSAVVASSFAYGTAAGLVGNTAKQSIDIATGKQKKGFDAEELVLNTGFSAATAGFTQWALPGANISGLTVGRNSFNAIGQSMMTKAANNTIQNISYSTGAKMAAGAQAGDLYRALAGALADLSRALAGWAASNNAAIKTSR